MNSRFALWALLYALAVLYVSVVVGPLGFHFVAFDPGQAWNALLSVRYINNGPDQRADWMANLVMAMPLGMFLTGALWTRKPEPARWLAAGLAVLLCLIFVVAVKYLQLFFPPRTVSLNYILAQSLGSVLGVALFCAFHQRLRTAHLPKKPVGMGLLRTALSLYALALFLYILFPFDFVLSALEYRDHLALLPHVLFSWPAEDRSIGVQMALVLAYVAESLPLGLLFAIDQKRFSVSRALILGLIIFSCVTLTTLFVMSATPHLVAILFRTLGFVAGAALRFRLARIDVGKARLLAASLAWLLVLPYILSVFYVNSLFSGPWQSLNEARAAFDWRGLLPLWTYYIVSKAHGMESLAVHAVTFAPIGILVSLTSRRPSPWLAAILGFLFSFAIEAARALKPGLQPDFNGAVIAAISAFLAVKAMPLLWTMLESLSKNREAILSGSDHALERSLD